ncbi:MAG: biotin--[acetyl-CoA-carboxylase] ligase [Ruminococcaceae bacterium]|nr:biotin--[acetyl-CoA-carboxylase] ligase [Oscillospiraceae bacterium]
MNVMPDINKIFLQSIPSTNTYAKENAFDLPMPSLIIADEQTAGRGRQGKKFFSPKDSGLYMTLVFPAPHNCELLTPAAAIAVCKALEKLGAKPEIKWVNDIFIDGLKVCGILTECFNCKENTYIALGVGINLTTSNFPDELFYIAGSVNTDCSKTVLAEEITNSILEYVYNQDNTDILCEYEKRLFIIGKKISYQKNNKVFSAEVKGINKNCNLIVIKDDGQKEILSSGEISIKL